MSASQYAALIAALTTVSGLALAAIARDMRRLPGRLLVRAIEAFLHHAATRSQDRQEPLP